ncbi:MAG TPA: isoprenylcysteine carboxylmethyltransferase family protein [Sporichthyaceae bacterium]|jgi:protein-S-isoprenylcysteine O-methyltransferase Ste14|nr:isoprenylcysteine carboxylmethyltransferase family protein [Sporichthyaceae bacterium]
MLRAVIYGGWALFWLGWLAASVSAKRGSSRAGGRRIRGVAAIGVFVTARLAPVHGAAMHDTVPAALGAALFACGLAVAIWARVNMGRNWGMPMTLKDEPELVTSGPYRLIRHPIYSGILLAVLGTALAVNLDWLVLLAVLGAYFLYSARVEEHLMTAEFPVVYPAYRNHTKMLVPFLL